MDAFRVLEIKKSVFENNDRQADLLREELKRNHTFLLNLMSSPGSGKTTTLMSTPTSTPRPSPPAVRRLSSCTPAACATSTRA